MTSPEPIAWSLAWVSVDLLARDFECCRRAERVGRADTSLPENVCCTLYRMLGQAELIEIWFSFSGFKARCSEGM